VQAKASFLILISGLILILSGCKAGQEDYADIVLTNARIYTVNDEVQWAEAVAIKDDRFVYVGDAAGAEAFVGETTSRTDLGGSFVMPGIIDGHTHPGMMDVEKYGPRLPEGNHEDLLNAVKAYAESAPGDGWVRMCCWSNFEYLADGKEGPNKADLDAVVSDRPVWITSLTWHSYWLNSKGLEVLGIYENTPDPVPHVANYVRDENGDLTGWIKEGAGWQFTAKHFPLDMEQVKKGIDTSLNALSTHGVTTIYDGGNWDFEDEIYGYLSELDKAGTLPLRYEGTYVVYLPERRYIAVKEMKRLSKAYGGERLKFRTIKLFMDGISPELAAGMIEPYTSHTDQIGGTTLTVEELRDWLLELHTEKFDLHVHTIGDLSVRKVLDAVEAAKAIVGDSFYPRVTVAHLEVIDPTDWARFGALGVTANFTPWWFGRAAEGAVQPMLGEERSKRLYPAKQMIKAGANVTFSSDDWSEEAFTPFLGMQVGHNRLFPDEWGDGTAKPDASEFYRISLENMIHGYTIRGAHPFRMEDKIGSIEVGKSADLLVLDNNPFEVSNRAIHTIKPTVVMLEGKVIQGELVGLP